MKLSKVQKAAIADTVQGIKRKKDAALAEADARVKKVQANLREEVRAHRSESLQVGLATIAAGAAASQVHRELAVKRGKTGIAKGINYGASALGLYLAYKAKPNQAGMRVLGAGLCGMGAGQAFADLSDVDLIPGFNG